METTHSPAAREHASEFDVHQVLRDGALVAVLMAIDHGDTVTVVTEVFGQGDSDAGSVQRRPYTFSDADSAHAFIAEAVTSFTYLGCEVRKSEGQPPAIAGYATL